MHIRVFHCRLDFWFDFPMFLVDFVIEISWVVMGSGGGDWVVVGRCWVDLPRCCLL